MTTANEILYSARNAVAAIEAADKLTTNVEQDWRNEATLFIFDDESVLLVSGPQVNAYESLAEAKADLND